MSIFSKSSLIGLYFTPLLIAPAFVQAGATDIPQQGARASGQAEAFAAQADDPSAIWHNPAGLTQLHGTYLQDGGVFIVPDWSFHPANEGESQSMRMPSVLPQVYIVSDLGTQNWRVGFGANNVFGLSEEWKNNGPLTSDVTQAHLFCYNFAPSVAYKFNEHLSLGLDLNVYWGDLELTRHVPLGSSTPSGTPQGNFHFRGQDAAIGATPAVMWKINDQNTIGEVYRSPFDFGFSGQARLKTPSGEVGPSHAHAYLNMPQMATIAYAFRPVKPLKLEADVVWTDWHTVKNTTLTSSNPAFNQVIKDDWMSGFSFRVGGQYDLTKKLALRAGYAFGQNAIPSSTFSPLVPDSNYHLASFGFQYALNDSITLDAAYQYIYREKRHIAHNANPTVDGTWSNQFNEVMFSATIKL